MKNTETFKVMMLFNVPVRHDKLIHTGGEISWIIAQEKNNKIIYTFSMLERTGATLQM